MNENAALVMKLATALSTAVSEIIGVYKAQVEQRDKQIEKLNREISQLKAAPK